MTHKIFLFFSFFLFLISCKTANINYMENIENVAVKTSIENSKIKLQPGDIISIGITAKDPEVVKPFVQGTGYLVDSEGNIVISTLGKIYVVGKNVEELRGEISERLKEYVREPIVSVALANFKVTVLGEVAAPGAYAMPDQANILTAIGAARDLTIYGERKNILLVRNVNGEITKQFIDITDANFINSPYYYLKQNDVIYVSANKAKANSSKYGSETSVYITVGSVIISVLLTIITLVKN